MRESAGDHQPKASGFRHVAEDLSRFWDVQ